MFIFIPIGSVNFRTFRRVSSVIRIVEIEKGILLEGINDIRTFHTSDLRKVWRQYNDQKKKVQKDNDLQNMTQKTRLFGPMVVLIER